jgi:peptide/nickel transport system substrate-binding protein
MAFVMVLGIIAGACASADEGSGEGGTSEGEVQKGGTFRGALISDVADAWDPHKSYYSVNWGFYRALLLRTLVNYEGVPTEEGGNDIKPDLATDLPEVNEDNTVWTFTLQEGIMYQPPLQDTEVVAEDFQRSFERLADPKASEGGYAFYYSVIEGFDEFGEGKADSISGINVIDDYTIEFTLTEPVGDFGYRMAMPATAPLPEGVADGHVKDYGRFLIGTGPYMFEGSEDLDFSVPPEDQEPVAGYTPNKSFAFVRNPSWDAETDELREAYVDRIEVEIGGTETDISNKIDAGDIDLMIDGVPPAQQVRKYATDPELQDQLKSNPSDAVRYLSFNLGEPPFDDIAVRKAVNFAIDKDGMRRIRGGEEFGDIAGHIIVPGLLSEEFADLDPYPSEGGTGDIDAAKEAMKESKYDTDGDGVCDAPECEDIFALTDQAEPYPDQAKLIQDNLEPLGLTFELQALERDPMYEKCLDPGAHVAFCLAPSWGKDYADATTFAEPLFGEASLGPDSCCNYSLVGASDSLLKEFDYDTNLEIPNVDEDFNKCEPLAGDERLTCWGEFDQTLMEDVVPWVPYLFDNDVDVISSRVTNYDFDQFWGGMAYDSVAVSDE